MQRWRSFLIKATVLVVLLLAPFFIPQGRSTAAVIIFFLFLFYLIEIIASRFLKVIGRYSLVALTSALIVSVIYYRFWTVEGVLASHGVYFDPDAENFESSGLNAIHFWAEGKQGRLVGPEMYGDLLFIEMPYCTQDGHLEFVVKSKVYPDLDHVRIRLIVPPDGDKAFQIVENSIGVFYPPQKGLRSYP